jgi:Cof subfamily protein (haloacid dehalogenase superfamily)
MFLLTPGGRHDEWEPTPAELVALDVDGTLVGLDGQVSAAVVAAIARARGAGLHLGLATGRMADGVADVLERTGLPGPHIFFNGAQVRRDGEVLASWPVATDVLAALLDACEDAQVYVEVYVDGGFLVNRMDERARPHWDLLGQEPAGVVHDVDDLAAEVPKVTAIAFDRPGVDRIVKLMEGVGVRPGPAGSPATPGLHYVNGNNPEADKGHALLAAAAALGVEPAATVAIGDERNDLSMLEVAGTAIAMGNATRQVRDMAHLVAPDVEQHGAAAALDAAAAQWRGVSGAE